MIEQVSPAPQPGADQSESGAEQPSRRPAWLRWELYALLELCGLCGLAIAQPLLDVIGGSPDFFFFHGAGAAQVLMLLAAVTLGPPLALWGVGVWTRLAGERVRGITHAVLVAVLAAVLAVQVGKVLSPLRGWPLAVLAALAGALLAVGYARFTVPRQVLRVAAVGPLVFGLLFVFASPSSAVVVGKAGPNATAANAVGPHPPIVVLVFDELPLMSLLDGDGQIDAERVPHFARLAGESTWYRNATTVSGSTTYAVPSMLTGRYPTGENAPHFSRHPENLFTLLGGAYQIEAWENVTQLCPPEHCRGRPGQARGSLPAMLRESVSLLGQIVSPRESLKDPTASFREPTVADEIRRNDKSPEAGPDFRMSRLAENQPARFTDFLASLSRATAPSPPTAASPPTAPTMHFLHLLMPHAPWQYLPSGMRYDAPGGLPFDGEWWARLAHQRHLQQVGYTDLLLGEALRALERSGRYDESLIIVTSDHGDSFSQGVSGRDMDGELRAAAELAWVPLFVKEPGQRTGRIDDRNWEQVDLLPTIADYAGVQVPWSTDGISALRERRDTTDKRFDHKPGKPMIIDAPAHFSAVLQGPGARPVLPEMPLLELVGTSVAELPTTTGGGPSATVENLAAFDQVRPEQGVIPALVHGTLPDTVPVGTPLAIAVNGRIGAVVLAARDRQNQTRFVGLMPDESLFVPGANRLELFLVTGDGTGLQRLSI